MLIDGKWTADWHPVQAKDEKGGFVRQTSSFRHWVTPDGAAGITGDGGFIAEPGRYHLYVALICPWASRTLIARKLKGLEEIVSLSVVEPWLLNEGWHFGDYPGSTPDALKQVEWLHQLYTYADPHFTGRATVPVLWDKKPTPWSTTSPPISCACLTPDSAISPAASTTSIRITCSRR